MANEPKIDFSNSRLKAVAGPGGVKTAKIVPVSPEAILRYVRMKGNREMRERATEQSIH